MTSIKSTHPEHVNTAQHPSAPRSFSATDYTDGCGNFPEEMWWIGIWAETEEQALEFAKKNYTENDEVESVTIQGVVDAAGWEPDSWPQEECRCKVLREAGWRSEGEHACGACELYAVDLDEFAVCHDCFRCAKCSADASDCETCNSCGQ